MLRGCQISLGVGQSAIDNLQPAMPPGMSRSFSEYCLFLVSHTELKGLISDIKAHPDRYVKVKFSLFK
jgi:hypothetical protein